ncbi:MAG: hypothetical protein M1830_006973 [Pleopsidium flavum]|nr:MAG: hypothetical protein M1830_006973 [Pleopsidium flavum]
MASQGSQNVKDTPHSSAERIKQLNTIDKDITRLLNSAGLAVKALTKTRQLSTEDEPLSASLGSHKAAFTSAASQYFSLLSSIDVRLRRQIYALEEADIIFAEASTKESQTSSALPAAFVALGGGNTVPPSSQVSLEKSSTAASGTGNLDVGWLNSRNDAVGKEMEAELWAKARDFVDTLKPDKLRDDTVAAQEVPGRITNVE